MKNDRLELVTNFANKYLGKSVRDGECVALFRQYMEEVFKIPHTGSVEGAYDLWTTYEKNPKMQKYFERIEGKPEPGDAAIFRPVSTNKYGHVAIVIAVNENGVRCVEQDGFKKGLGTKEAFWNWDRYAGALRAREA